MTQQQASGAQQIALAAGQKITATMNAGENLVVSTGTSVQGMNMVKGGALVISFSEGTTLTITNFAEVSKLSPPPSITLPSGQTINLADLAQQLSSTEAADASPTLQAKETVATGVEAKDAGKVIIIDKPGAKEDVVVKIVPGQDYKFSFDMTEPSAVTQKGGELVISFKNGGEIIIPNYGAAKGSDTDFTMNDGAKLSASDFGDMLASAAQLNAVEPAAGEGGASQRGAGGGFGFGSAFQYTPFENVNPIGPIAPTALNYQAPDRGPNPGDNDTPPVLAPTLAVQDEWIKEDGTGALDIDASLNNPQANDTLTITVTGFLPGWTVDTTASGGTYDPATGTWTITLPAGTTSYTGGPSVSPPADWDGDMPNLDVTATATRGAQTADSTGQIDVFVDAVIDGPSIDGTNETTTEDTPVVLHITAGAGGDTADGSETLSAVTITGVPVGATLSAGTYDAATNTWTVPVASLPGLTLTPPPHFHGDITLTVSITDTETALTGAENDVTDNSATATDSFTIHVDNTIGKPVVQSADKWVYEDGQGGPAAAQVTVDASLTNPGPNDQLTVTITGIPAGWTVTDLGGGTFAGGTWTITLPVGTNSFSGGPTIQPPADSDADAPNLQITATASDGLINSSSTTTANVFNDAVIDGPSIDAPDAAGAEDTPIALNISVDAGGDNADGSEVLSSITVTGVPTGATLNHGTQNPDGSWTLNTTTDLVGLTITPPSHFSGSFTLTVSVTDTETNLSGNELTTANNSATDTDTILVTVQNTIDAPKVSAKDVWVKEDSSVALQVQASLTDPGPGDHLVVNITGFLPGWTFTNLAGGTYDAATNTWSITLAPGANFSGGPTIAPPPNSDADSPNLNVTVFQTDGSVTSSAGTTTNVFTDAVIDGPSIDGANGSGPEDTAIPLTITVSAGGDNADGSEVLSNITLGGLPLGSTLNHGTYNAGTNTWTLTQADLVGLTLTPPHNWSGNITATVSVTDTETNLSGAEQTTADNSATATDTFTIAVTPVPDAPTVSAPDKWVKEDGTVQLQVQANLTDTDGSESLTVSISGFLPGWTVTNLAGGTFAGGTWTITLPPGANFNGGPTIRPPADSDADMPNLTVTATSTEGANGASASTTTHMNVFTDAVIDAPTINAPDVNGNEDTSIPLSITVSKGGDSTDGSEVLSSITITGVPNDATLNHGVKNPDGSWTLTTADLTGLTITPAHNYNGNFTLTVKVTDTETNLSGSENDLTDNSATATDTIKVTVNPVGDDPSVKMDDVKVKEDGSVALKIDATMSPGSGAGEYLTVTLTGIPSTWGVNTSVSGGTYTAATGTWTVTLPAGTNFSGGPTFSPPANSDVDLTGLVATVNQYTSGGTLLGSATDGASIFVDAVIDGPSINAPDTAGEEDTAIALNITVSRGGDTTDGSETLSNVTISGVPLDATLSAGTNLGGGVWSLTTAQLAGLKITPNTPGTINLTVSVTDTETNLSGSEWDLTDNSATATDTIKIVVTKDDVPNLADSSKQVDETDLGPITVNGAVTGTFGADGPGTFTATGVGTFSASGEVAGTQLTSEGHPVVVTLVGNTYIGKANGVEVFSLKVNANGSYEFKLTGTLDHRDTTNPNEPIDLKFGVTATDSDGDTDTADITIRVLDDAPVAHNDYNNLTVTTTTQPVAKDYNIVLVLDVSGSMAGNKLALMKDAVNNLLTNFNGYTGGAVKVHFVTFATSTMAESTFTITNAADFNAAKAWVNGLSANGTTNYEDPLQDAISWLQSTTGNAPIAGASNFTYFVSDGEPNQYQNNSNVSTSGSADVVMQNITGTYDPSGTANDDTTSEVAILKGLSTVIGVGLEVNSTTLGRLDVIDSNGDALDVDNAADLSAALQGANPVTVTTVSVATGNVITGVNGGPGAADALSEDDANTVVGVSFEGGPTVAVPAGGFVLINGDEGVLKLFSDGSYTYTANNNADLSDGIDEVFTYTLKDGDGDTSLATLTFHADAPLLKVGKNANDITGSTTTYEVGGGPGVINGGGAGDVLVGDVGGSSVQNVNKDYNIVLILDVSGSMEGSKLTLLKGAVNNLMTSFNSYTGGTVKIHFVTFSDNTKAEATYTVTNASEFNAAKTWVNNLVAGGTTNYEDPMQDAITWLQSTTGNKPIAGADTYTYFVSDGEPNRFQNNSGVGVDSNADQAMQNIHGTYNPSGTTNDDTVSEVAILQSLSTDLIGVGIGVSSTTLARLDTIDKNGDALDVQNPADLSAALQGASPLNQLAAVGGDVINGGTGDDLIFGDSLNTDALATAKGLSTLKGAGWEVFAQLEASGTGWTRTDTINYIKSHGSELSQESVGTGGAVRTGGSDTLNGGDGNDIIYGQEGNDLITGGKGNDQLSGGTGGDTFIFHNGDGIDHISDFNIAQGDKLDISDILTSFDPLHDNLQNFVHTVTSGADTLVQVDPTGTGAAFQTVVVLEGVHIDVNALAAGGNLIA